MRFWCKIPLLVGRKKILARIRAAVNGLLGCGIEVALNDVKSHSRNFTVREYIDYYHLVEGGRSRKELLQCLETGCQVLEELGVDYCVAGGTLLGLFRDGEFLPKEHDIDIYIYSEKYIFEIIRKMPFDVMVVATNDLIGAFTQLCFLDRRSNTFFDIWIYRDEDEYMVSHMWTGTFRLPKSIIQNRTTLNVDGREYPVPEPEEYCCYWYGKDYRKPKSYSEDWVAHYERDCQGFTHDPTNALRVIKYYES